MVASRLNMVDEIQLIAVADITTRCCEIRPGREVRNMILDEFKVKCLLAERGFGVVELAKRAGCQHKTIKRAFDGLEITPQSVGKIARALETNPAEIVIKERSTAKADQNLTVLQR